MQLTATEAVCPLCRRSVNAEVGHSDPTRLCEDCQRIVQTVRSAGSPRVAVMEPPPVRAMPQPQVATLAQSESILSAPGGIEEAGQPFRPPEHEEGEYLPLECQPSAESDPFDVDELFDQGSPRESLPHPMHASQDLNLTSQPAYKPASQSAPATCAVAEAPIVVVASTNVIYDTPIEASSDDSLFKVLIDSGADSPEYPEACEDRIETNPSESPAHYWNYSPDEFPIMLQASEPGRLARLKIPLAAALLLVCGIGGYFLVYRPVIQASQTSQMVIRVQPPELKPSSTGAVASVHQQAASQPSPRAAAPSAAGRENETPAPTENAKDNRTAGADSATGRGRYSLQAAAFPNEPGASEFSERLKRTGVPAYVVAADIAGRGRWFRVRVGRFETAKDADRFAAEARQRASAAGLSLRLIVSSYEKP
jgi:cell division protein FtsN